MLEENAVPSIWISNAIDHIDPAYLRRFMFVIEVPPPPRAVRRQILGRVLGDVGVSDEWLTRLAGRSEMTPAQLEQARKVVLCLKPESIRDIEGVLDRVLDRSVETRGENARPPLEERLDVGEYDVSYVNSSLPLPDVVSCLGRRRRTSMLLYGPPGTGKTGFVAHLGAKLDMPVLAKRVSDLQSSWLGQTKKTSLRRSVKHDERERFSFWMKRMALFKVGRTPRGAGRSRK